MECKSIEDSLVHYDNFAVSYIEYGCDVTEHIHNGIEIVYIVAGHGEHIIDGNVVNTKRGSLLFMDYNCVHKIQMWETMKYYNIMFSAAFLSDNIKKDANLQEILIKYYNVDIPGKFFCVDFEDEDEAQRIERLFFDMLNEGIKKNSRYIEITKCHFNEVLNLMIRTQQHQEKTCFDSVLVEAMSYIKNNSTESLKLENVAKKFKYKSGYFSKRLKEYCGMSFKQLLISKRLSDAVSELLTTSKSVDEIIQECGFTNKTYFYDVFEKAYGVKPKFIREYRNNYKKYIEIKTKYKALQD